MSKSAQDFEATRISAYFAHLTSMFGTRSNVEIVGIAHMVPNSLHFIPALNLVGRMCLLLPKPKSVYRPEYTILSEQFTTEPLSREWAEDGDLVIETINRHVSADGKVILIDIGGYYAASINNVGRALGDRLLGVMEGTENGVQKYEEAGQLNVAIVTVARSPLKLPEDYLVGASVVFSIEAVLRELAQILQTRTACVIGYGRVGSSVASILRGRGINTVIYDIDPIKLAEAAARGYQTFRRRESALKTATLVVCATGAKALDSAGFASLRPGAVVATVTSGDDELDLAALLQTYEDPTAVSPSVARYDERGTDRYFWLVNNGNAANFLHGAIIGPAIQLIEGEKLASISLMASGAFAGKTGILELGHEHRTMVAEVWNEHFLED